MSRCPALLCAQRGHRADTRRSPSRQVDRSRGGYDQDGGDANERYRVERVDAVEQRHQQSRRADCQSEADQQAEQHTVFRIVP